MRDVRLLTSAATVGGYEAAVVALRPSGGIGLARRVEMFDNLREL